ncbi:MAG TPA: cation-transporting P-type ATPase [Streptosporangiaceae bacterium]|nr:cation-transporting P-type ATPase [Streptosporangiaceae bacterium]
MRRQRSPAIRDGGSRDSRRARPQGEHCLLVPLTTAAAAALPVHDVLDRLESGLADLPEGEARQRLVTAGPNAVRSHRARAWPVLARQLRSWFYRSGRASAAAAARPAVPARRRRVHRRAARFTTG